jgi:hypothetical protein
MHLRTRALTGEILKYSVEMASDAMIYIPNFMKIGSGIQKLTGEGGSETRCMVIS